MHSSNVLLKPISIYPPRLHLFPPKPHNFHTILNLGSHHITKMSFLGELGFKIRGSGSVGATGDDGGAGFPTLAEYMGKGCVNVGDELVLLFSHLEYACKRIAALVASPFNSNLANNLCESSGSSERDKPKPLDIIAVASGKND